MKKLRRSEIPANRAGCSLKCRTGYTLGPFREPVPQQNEKPPDRYRAVMRSLFDPLLHVHARADRETAIHVVSIPTKCFMNMLTASDSSMGSAFP